MKRLLTILSALAVVGFSIPSIAAGNAANGAVLYGNALGIGCSGCHGPASNNKDGILLGANNPSYLMNVAFTVSDMVAFQVLAISDVNDIAAYLATQTGATTRQLSVAAAQNFGSQTVGNQSAATAITVTSTGTASVTISGSPASSNAAEFPIVSTTCSGTLASGASCKVNVAFKPSATGARSGNLTITTTNGSPASVTTALSGTGASAATPGVLTLPAPLAFGTQTVNVQTAASTATLTNTGGSAVTMSSVSSTNAGEFPITFNSCVGTVNAGATCQIGVAFKPAAAGARSGSISIVSSGTGSPQSLGVSGTGAATATPGQLSLPAPLVFASQAISVQSATTMATITNIGGSPVTVSGVSSTNAAEFPVTSNSCVGTINAGASCQIGVAFTPSAAGARSGSITIVSTGTGSPQSLGVSGTGSAGGGAATVMVIEYYNASLDHYFITWIANEIAILDAGVTIKGWVRTGKSFTTYSTTQPGTSPVCRYYIPPALGNSHFFGRGTTECNATGQKNPSFVLEDPNFMFMFLPVLGVCPANTTEVFRVFSNRVDANHRYMTDKATRDLMVTKSWLAEGDGPDMVVMCAPQ